MSNEQNQTYYEDDRRREPPQSRRTPPTARPSTHRKKRRRRPLFPLWYKIIFIIAIIIVVAFVIYKIASKPPKIDPGTSVVATDTTESTELYPQIHDSGLQKDMVRREGVYTLLIFGVDESGGNNTDTIMVGCYDVKNQSMALVSVPRDTMLHTSEYTRKINSSYPLGGTEMLEDSLEQLLGIPIDFYIKIDLDGFMELVDAIGGVWYDVPIDMHYWDPTADLHIDLDAGYQLLNGEHAMWLVRFRSGYATQDLGRLETQHDFFQVMLRQALKVSNIRTLIPILEENVETNLSLSNLLWFGDQFLHMDTDTIYMETLPYANASYMYNGRSYLTLDPEGTLEIINEHLNPYTEDLTLDQMNIYQP